MLRLKNTDFLEFSKKWNVRLRSLFIFTWECSRLKPRLRKQVVGFFRVITLVYKFLAVIIFINNLSTKNCTNCIKNSKIQKNFLYSALKENKKTYFLRNEYNNS